MYPGGSEGVDVGVEEVLEAIEGCDGGMDIMKGGMGRFVGFGWAIVVEAVA